MKLNDAVAKTSLKPAVPVFRDSWSSISMKASESVVRKSGTKVSFRERRKPRKKRFSAAC